MTDQISATTEEAPASEPQKVTRAVLTAMVVGSMIGAGVFSLPARFGIATGVIGALIAWLVAGTGMLMLAFVFQTLAIRKPKLDSGVFIYAKAGFGDYMGFNSAVGFWASACAGNTFYWVFMTATVGAFFPRLGAGDTLLAVAISTVGIWLFHYLIARGVRDAAIINRIVTVFKVLPILTFIIVVLFAFNWATFSANFLTPDLGTLTEQVKNTMIITTFVFIGIEGASVYSRFAQKREHVGQATVLGFLSVLAIFALVTMVSYGSMPQVEIAGVRQPSMAGVFADVVGPWGETFISVAVLVSVLGAYLAWTLMAAEVLYMPAHNEDMPRFLGRENKAGTPITALIASTIFVQSLLVLTLFVADALNFMLDLCTSLALLPYLLAAAYSLKLAITGESYRDDEARARRNDATVAGTAIVYTIFLFVAAGLKFVLLSCVILAPAALLYVKARRERGRRVFTPRELGVFIAVLAGGVIGVLGLVVGFITI
ncbi:MAG TPA: basic amino acid/polyamine antiporter [Microlunatus sp.]|nr:basic amino acid/polyamine antiporter [Microlunatus sp.]